MTERVAERPATAELDVLLVVVTYNSRRHLAGLLASLPSALAGSGSWQLAVADNGSTDATLDDLGRLAPDAVVVRMGGNRGYAAGINAALAAGPPSRSVLVLNPDIRLGPGSVRLLLDALAGTVGVTLPRLTDEAGRLAHSLRREPTVLRALGESLLGGRVAGRFPALGEVVRSPASYGRAGTADWATGACLLLSAGCLAAVGRWDESYFLYSEETDFLLRAGDAGFRVELVPSASAVHCGGDAHVSPALWSRLTVNRVRLFGSRHGRARTYAFWGAVAAGEALRSVTGRPTHRAALTALLHHRETVGT